MRKFRDNLNSIKGLQIRIAGKRGDDSNHPWKELSENDRYALNGVPLKTKKEWIQKMESGEYVKINRILGLLVEELRINPNN